MYAKISTDGLNGSGKSFTMAELAVGLAKEYCDSRPVLVFDSEDRWRFLKALIFDVEKIPLVIVRGTSLAVLQDALQQCRKDKCAVFVGDQLTTPWKEALRAFSYDNGNLPFDRRQQMMNEWDKMVRAFKGPFHAIACGRLGFNWENIEDPDTGDVKLTQGDSKFNAGGGENFGYECELELEMRRRKARIAKRLFARRSLIVEHVCDVVKDVTTMLSGQQFAFPDTTGGYKAGSYKPVLQAVRPHIEFMQRLEAPTFDPAREERTSSDLLVQGRTPWAANKAEKTALLEELEANLTMCFPAGEGKSKLAKMFRDLTLESLNGFISWSRMEDECPVDHLMRNVAVVKAVRARIEKGELPVDQKSLSVLLELSAQDVYGRSGKDITLLEAMGLRSVSDANAKRGPQPVVKAIDEGEAEVAGD